MDAIIALAVILFFAAIVYLAVATTRKKDQERKQAVLSIGFSPIEITPDITEKITQLYRAHGQVNAYKLENLYKKAMPDADIYIFDMINTSGKDNSQTESQAVAVVSRYLNLPVFVLIPKPDIDGWAGSLTNRMLDWASTRFGQPVEFPDHPEFNKHYLVSSPTPENTLTFFNQTRIHLLDSTRMYTVRAGGDIFIFNKQVFSAGNQEPLSQLVNQAIDIFQIFSD